MFKGGIMFKAEAMIHSLESKAEVTILSFTDNNNVIAKYGKKTCTAIFNIFTNCFYVDDIYGVISEEE
jgi:hypothetical protein